MPRNKVSSYRTLLPLLICLVLVMGAQGLAFLPKLQAAPGDSIIYVDQNATGANDGSSWQNAYTDLQDALAAAQSNHSIWIAKGIYRPVTQVTNLATDSLISFNIPNGVELYGGFAGTETDLAQRNWEVNKTILSGDLAGDDLTDADGVVVHPDDLRGTNSRRVLSITNATDTVVLDGLFITAGWNTSIYVVDTGPGIFMQNAKTILRHLVVAGHSSSKGGALTLIGSDTELSDSSFSGNRAHFGGAIFSSNSHLNITNVSFSGNSVFISGGAIYNENNSEVTITNASFSHNTSVEFGSSGGAIYNRSSELTIINSSFVENSTPFEGGAIYNYSSNVSITNTSFSGNSTGPHGGGAIYNHSSNSSITNATFSGNNSDFGGAILNYSSDSSITNATFSGNSAFRGGVIYNDNSDSILSNSIIWGNASDEGDNPSIFIDSSSGQTIRYSLVEGCNSGGTWNSACGSDGGGNLADADPLFVNPISHTSAPTTTGDLHLKPGSPAIDQGNTSLNTTSTDLDGKPRVGNGIIDLGAYEFGYRLAKGIIGSGQLVATPSTDWHLPNTTVTVSAAANSGWSFVGWSGDLSGTSSPTTLLIDNSKVITATFSNDPPIAHAGDDQIVVAGTLVTLDGSGSYDEDPTQTITHAWTQTAGTPVTLTGANTAQPTFTAPSVAGTLTFSLVVTDSLGVVSDPASVTITVTNDEPVADAGEDQTVLVGTLVTLDGSKSSDPDGHTPLTYGWTQTAGTTVTLTGANTAQPTFTAPSVAGTLTFSLVVTDSMGLVSDPASVTITVTNGEPVANAGEDQTVLVGTLVTLDGSKSSDPDGHTPLSYSWTQTSGTPVTLTGANTAQPTFTAPSVAGTLTFSLVVTDSMGLASAADTVTITVEEAPKYLIYLPRVLGQEQRPNLVITELSADQNGLKVVISNIGDAANQADFWVDLYVNPSQQPTANTVWQKIAPAGAVWLVKGTLEPGQSITLTQSSPFYVADYSYGSYAAGDQLYAYVDSYHSQNSYGVELESDESDNLAGPVTATGTGAFAGSGLQQLAPSDKSAR